MLHISLATPLLYVCQTMPKTNQFFVEGSWNVHSQHHSYWSLPVVLQVPEPWDGWRACVSLIFPLFSLESRACQRFPDVGEIAMEDYEYFISELNFDAVDNKIVVGAA